MKDRVKRTGVKKVSHRLVRASVLIASVSLLLSSALTAVIVHVASDSITLNESITHYGQEIDSIETQNHNVEKSYSRK